MFNSFNPSKWTFFVYFDTDDMCSFTRIAVAGLKCRFMTGFFYLASPIPGFVFGALE